MEIQMHPARPQNSHQPDETELPEGEADVSRSKFLRGGALALGAGTLGAAATAAGAPAEADRKSTRLNSSHVAISYAVFCLKKKRTKCAWFEWVTARGLQFNYASAIRYDLT